MMQRVVLHEMVARWVWCVAGVIALCGLSSLCVGCPGQELAPLGPCTISAASRRVDQSGLSKVDLLFVIDNSGSMATKQVKLANELPRLVQVLTTGNRNAGRAGGAATGQDMFTPVSSLHLGVVSSNMGGVDDPSGANAGIMACRGLGDDGKLQRSTEVAVTGVTANAPFEFPGYNPGDVVLAPDPACANVAAPPKYQEFAAGQDPSAEEIAASFRCVSKLGVRGCSYEQQLDAMWKAVAPSDGADAFFDDTKGHGNPKGFNAGFVRDDAILAVIQVSDEEDCSIKPEGKELFTDTAAATQKFGAEVNLRCGRHGESMALVWPVSRYINGLRALKPDNADRIIFAAIVGIPPRAVGMPFDQVLALPEMQFRAGALGQPTPSCRGNTGGRAEEAYPPRRFLQVAQGFGNDAVVSSICSDDFAPALDKLIDRIATKLSGNCLPRRLKRDASGKVQCDVYELLAEGETKCDAKRGHVGRPLKRASEASDGVRESRLACKMQQVAVSNQRQTDGTGWYYDDFTDQVKSVCPAGDQQRILFSFGELPEGASATFECLQPISSIDPNGRGVEAVNTACQAGGNTCRDRSDDDDKLICVDGTCQITCKANPECPPGWVCDTALAQGKGEKFCQLPTCPTDDTRADTASASSGGTTTAGVDAGRGRR
ncbi:MAG: hypothetical protein RLZZ450_4423 [Pseudomonadota bacterium]|jgi:hypothetical protein